MDVLLDAFQISGGVILFLFGLTLIFGDDKPEVEKRKLPILNMLCYNIPIDNSIHCIARRNKGCCNFNQQPPLFTPTAIGNNRVSFISCSLKCCNIIDNYWRPKKLLAIME